MKKALILPLLVAITTLLSCSKDSPSSSSQASPTANFTYSFVGNNSHAPSSVNFSSTSSSAYSFSWDFGDGTTGDGENIKHKYSNAGTYIVKLTVYAGQQSSIKTQTITIQPEYSSVSFKRITLTSTPASSQFDALLGIFDNSFSNVLWYSPDYLSIVPSSLPAGYTLPTPYTFPDLTSIYQVVLTDISTSTAVQTCPFIPRLYNLGDDDTNSYPTTVQGINGFSFQLQWQ